MSNRPGRLFFLVALLSCLGQLGVRAATDESLAALLGAAALNPDVRAAQVRLQAAKERSSFAGALSEPKLNVGIMQLLTLEGPSLTISQPFPNKRAQLAQLGALEIEKAQADYEAKLLEVRLELMRAYYEAIYLRRAIQLHHAGKDQVKQLAAIATTKYAVGSVMQQDPLRAQLELSRLIDSELELTQKLQSALDHLNSLVGRSLEHVISVPADFPPKRPDVDEAKSLQQAEASNPQLMLAETELAMAVVEEGMAEREATVPDIDVGIQVGRLMPGDMAYLGGMVGINLPWLAPGRFDSLQKAKRLGSLAAQDNYRGQLNRLHYRLRDLSYQLMRQERRLDLYQKGLLPQSAQALKAALSAYQVNKADITTVVDSQRAVFDTQMAYTMALAEYFKIDAERQAEQGLMEAP